MEKTNVYQMVTDRIIAELEKGIIPWQKPWAGASLADGGAINYVSRKPYSLLNQLLLGRAGEWLTFKQIQDKGGKVKKGAKSEYVVFFKMMRSRVKAIVDSDGNEIEPARLKIVPVLRYYHVFYINDCEGIESKAEEELIQENEPIEAAENVINGYLEQEPALKFDNKKLSDRAYYSPCSDSVVVPMLSQYEIVEEYYSTTFHELTHSTAAPTRCNRACDIKVAAFGSQDYSREELVAEMGAAMLCQHVGIDCDKAFKNSVAYIQGWLSHLKNDNHAIVWAAGRAEKAAKYILGIKDGKEADNE